MSSPLDLRIGTLATDTEMPVFPAEDQHGKPYIKNGIATVNLGSGKFAVVSAGQDPDKDMIQILKDRVKNGNVEEFETTPQDFSGAPTPTAPVVPLMPLGTFADQLDTTPPETTTKTRRGEK
jgi:hypothetical protein